MSNIGWEIENQYEILSQMISDVADRYHDEAIALEKKVDETYNKYANSDYNTFSNETQGLDKVLDKPYSLCYEARKILFCAIFSYFESMLHGISDFYNVTKEKKRHMDKLLAVICDEFGNRFSSELIYDEEDWHTIYEKYRPLRNYYMHGIIYDEMSLVIAFAQSEASINDKSNGHYEILDDDFLRTALSKINGFLVNIEEAYDNKAREQTQSGGQE